jgi:Zn-dependent protease with chaperone function
MSAEEVKAVIAHELAHYRNLDTSLHRYYGVADNALTYILRIVQEAIADLGGSTYTRRRYSNRLRGNSSALYYMIFAAVFWLLLLPIRIVWYGFRLLRLAESRQAEFMADRLAVQGYGAESFIGGLTMVSTTMERQARPQDYVIDDMRRLKTSNYYVAQRQYYAQLPEKYRHSINTEALQDYLSLENTHPTLGDRLIAAQLAASSTVAAPQAPEPATQLIIPRGASSAESIEVELSKLLLDHRASRRRRR